MASFLNRLFRYRASEKRRPLEDFLSEVLADFINRSPISEANNFIIECFIPRDLRNLAQSIIKDQRIHARTQVYIPNGKCLDILLEVEGLPIIILENKTWAAFQMHARMPEPASQEDIDKKLEVSSENNERVAVEYDHQLVTYGHWLSSISKPNDWPGVLSVLTHAALPPTDFTFHNSATYGVVPHLQFWRNIHAHLRKSLGNVSDNQINSAWKFVGLELATFLEINEMDSSDLSAVEISSINVSISPLKKLKTVFAEVGTELVQRQPSIFVRRGHSTQVRYDDSFVWGWNFLKEYPRSYIGYGLYFSSPTGEFALAVPPLSDQEHAFIAVGSDDHVMNFVNDTLPNGWNKIGDGHYIVKAIPLSMRHNEERFPQFILRKINESFDEIYEIFQKDDEINTSLEQNL